MLWSGSSALAAAICLEDDITCGTGGGREPGGHVTSDVPSQPDGPRHLHRRMPTAATDRAKRCLNWFAATKRFLLRTRPLRRSWRHAAGVCRGAGTRAGLPLGTASQRARPEWTRFSSGAAGISHTSLSGRVRPLVAAPSCLLAPPPRQVGMLTGGSLWRPHLVSYLQLQGTSSSAESALTRCGGAPVRRETGLVVSSTLVKESWIPRPQNSFNSFYSQKGFPCRTLYVIYPFCAIKQVPKEIQAFGT